jgi:signal peptidase I
MNRTVKGESMRPFLRALDLCGTVKALPGGIRAGDIVVYENPSGEGFFVHRVVDVEGDYAVVKGDNVPMKYAEKIALGDIMEKVAVIKRGERKMGLTSRPAIVCSRIIAFLSRRDLTPLLLGKRFIDPVILSITRSRLYISFRKAFYGAILFSLSRSEKEYRVYAFVGRDKSADAVIRKNGAGVLVDLYIRRRDRNPVFAEKFMHKIIEVADKEYGGEPHIRVNDKVMKLLVGSTDEFFFSDRISFK